MVFVVHVTYFFSFNSSIETDGQIVGLIGDLSLENDSVRLVKREMQLETCDQETIAITQQIYPRVASLQITPKQVVKVVFHVVDLNASLYFPSESLKGGIHLI